MAAQPVESRIQDLIYGLEVGFGLRLVRSLLYLLFVVLVMILYVAREFTAFADAEAMETAQLARNLSETGSFTTQVVRPATMRFLIENKARTVTVAGEAKTVGGAPRIEDHPDILHPPLYPATLAGWFRLLGAEFTGSAEGGKHPPEQWIVALCGLFSLGTGLFILLLGRLLFDHRIGLLGMTVFFLSDSVWRITISGTNIAMATFLATAACYFAVLASVQREQDRPAAAWLVPYLTAALLTALLALTRYGALVFVPALTLFFALSFPGRRLAAALGLLLIVAAGLTPWAIRNVQVSGVPWGYALQTVLHDSRYFPGNTLERSLAPDPEHLEFTALVEAVRGKWVRNVSRVYDQHLWTIGDGLLCSFFVVTFFYGFARARVRRFRWGILLAMLLLAGLAGFFGAGVMRLFYLFWPMVILYGLALFFLLLDRLDFEFAIQRMGLTSVVVLLTALPLLVTLMRPTPAFPYPPYFRPSVMRVCSILDPDQVICSDMPWATAWYGNRTSLLLPSTLDEFYRIHDFIRDIDALYFTTLTRDKSWHNELVTGAERTWYPLHNLRIPGDFPLREGVPLLNGDQLLITTRERLTAPQTASAP